MPAALLLLLSLSATAVPNPACPSAGTRQELTREEKLADLGLVLRTVRDHHPDPYAHHSPAEWSEAEQALRAKLEAGTDVDFFLELAQLVALLEDGHSGLLPTTLAGSPWQRYGVEFEVFSDGVYVIAASPVHRSLVGRRVTALGGVPVAEVLAKFAPFISADNSQNRLQLQKLYLGLPQVHHALGISDDPRSGWLTVRSEEGAEERVQLADPEPLDLRSLSTAPAHWTRVAVEAEPLWAQRPESSYWFEFLAEESIAYVRYRMIANDPEEGLAEFWERVFATIEEELAELLILDLRGNSGGNNYLNQSLIHSILRSPVNELGRLFAIVDRETHRLPHAGSLLRCSTVRWQDSDPRDDRPWIYPDLPAPLSFADYRAGRDPALEAIAGYHPRPLPGMADVAPIAHWMRQSQRRTWPPR